MRPNAKLMKASVTGVLGGLLYGFDQGCGVSVCVSKGAAGNDV